MSDKSWPTIGDLTNANWCGRKQRADQHWEHLSSCEAAWKESIQTQLSDVIRYRSTIEEITNESPRCYGIDIARIVAPKVVAFLKTKLPEANIFFAESDYVYIIIDWNQAPSVTINAFA